VAFAEKLLALLDTGSFTTSYKYALLLEVFDAAMEGTAADGSAPRSLRGRDLGRRVFELYWRQARPYSDAGPLRQSKQRDVVFKIADLRQQLQLAEHVSLDAARLAHPHAVGKLEREVVATVVRYPIPLLQRFGASGSAVEDRFIYEVPWDEGISPGRVHRNDFDDRLHLVDGAGEHLLAIAGLARPVVEREWLRHVARRNVDQVDELRLEAFLFGSERISLQRVRNPLLTVQAGRCFYCGGERGPWEVDHFLPWARWPDDRLDNLVVAHARCNNDKRAALAAWTTSSGGGRGSCPGTHSTVSWRSWPRPSNGHVARIGPPAARAVSTCTSLRGRCCGRGQDRWSRWTPSVCVGCCSPRGSRRIRDATTWRGAREGWTRRVRQDQARPTRKPAADLYISPLFVGRREIVERSCDRWFILSALHGLVAPEELVAPYDQTLSAASRRERRRWSAQVVAALREELDQLRGITFEIHAGSAYTDHGSSTGSKRSVRRSRCRCVG
jgi:5-methylcytosine-specific restriction endonuclease McrA